MNNPTSDDILSPKPTARPRIYAYAIADAAHEGLLKVGQTTRDVKKRIDEQLRTAAISIYYSYTTRSALSGRSRVAEAFVLFRILQGLTYIRVIA